MECDTQQFIQNQNHLITENMWLRKVSTKYLYNLYEYFYIFNYQAVEEHLDLSFLADSTFL